jgi:8-oxo-dGTP pyrophosphatase MutT (NUDIX family)
MAPPDEAEQPAPQGEQQKRKPPRRRRRRRKQANAAGGTTQQRDQAPAHTKGRKQGAQKAKGQAAKGTQTKKGAKARGGKKRRGAPRRPKIPTTREVSSGGVVYRRKDDGIEVVLASRRTRRGQLAWGLAKGGIETGESREVAAIREVREETGLTAEIEADLGDTKYMYVWDDIRIRKTVHFFLMRYTGGDVEDRDDEMEEIRWFPMERAIKRAAYRGERDMLVKASELLR